MKLRLGVLDVLLVIALVFAGIIIHNKYTAHPTPAEQKWLSAYVFSGGDNPKQGKSGGGGGEAHEWSYS
jgi:hypothetical protein